MQFAILRVMGRPKIDHSQTVCQNCKALGNYCARGLCRRCYGHNHFKATAVGEKLEKRRENARNWNRDNRERFNAAKRRLRQQSAGLEFEPEIVSSLTPHLACGDCRLIVPLYSKGRCLSCYGKERHKRLYAASTPRRMAVKYGISEASYNDLVIKADGKCATCLKPSLLVVDHCHATGKVRQLLCNACNLTLGHIEAAGQLTVLRMLAYIAEHSK